MATFDQDRFIADTEERVETIRRQVQAVLDKAEGHEYYASIRPTLEGVLTNTSHALNDLGLLRASLDR